MNWNMVEQHLNNHLPQLVAERCPAAVLVLFAGDRVVLEVRSSKLHTQPGEVCFPGGSMEPGESPVQCALRETEEELGINPEQIRVMGQTDYFLHRTGQIVYPVLAQADPCVLAQLCPAPDEVSEVFSIPLRWLQTHPPKPYEYRLQVLKNDNLPAQMIAWAQSYPNLRRGCYWDYDGRLIWGLTGKILQLVLKLLKSESF